VRRCASSESELSSTGKPGMVKILQILDFHASLKIDNSGTYGGTCTGKCTVLDGTYYNYQVLGDE
jgi:hypothetical protein